MSWLDSAATRATQTLSKYQGATYTNVQGETYKSAVYADGTTDAKVWGVQ